MPFTGNTYTGPTGSTNAAAGQVVQSAVWNAINTDYASALTLLMTQLTTHVYDFSNILLPNGGLNIWQRGTSIAVGASSTAYTADRWYLTTGANQASVVSAVTDLGGSGVTQHAAKIIRNAAQTGTTVMTFGYPFDTDEIQRLIGKQVSFSCVVKSGANWSPTSGTLTVTFAVGTGSPAKRGAGFTGETVVFTTSTNLAVSSAATTMSATSVSAVPAGSTQGELQFTWTPTGTAGADDSISVDNVFMSTGTIVQTWTDPPFEIAVEMCKRHYRKTFPYATVPAQGVGAVSSLTVITQAATKFGIYWQFSGVSLRATASFTTYNTATLSANWQNVTTGSSIAVTIDSANSGPKGVFIYSATATNVDNLIYIHAVADASI